MENIDTFFNENGWDFPDTDLGRKEQLIPIEAYRWSTLPDSLPAYLIDDHLETFSQNPLEFLLISHEGHGINSWFFHYYSVDAHLAYFMQLPFGNAESDIEEERSVIAGGLLNFNTIKKNLVAASAKINTPKKMVVVDSFIIGRKWAWQEKNQVGEWQSESPIFTALQASFMGT